MSVVLNFWTVSVACMWSHERKDMKKLVFSQIRKSPTITFDFQCVCVCVCVYVSTTRWYGISHKNKETFIYIHNEQDNRMCERERLRQMHIETSGRFVIAFVIVSATDWAQVEFYCVCAHTLTIPKQHTSYCIDCKTSYHIS